MVSCTAAHAVSLLRSFFHHICSLIVLGIAELPLQNKWPRFLKHVRMSRSSIILPALRIRGPSPFPLEKGPDSGWLAGKADMDGCCPPQFGSKLDVLLNLRPFRNRSQEPTTDQSSTAARVPPRILVRTACVSTQRFHGKTFFDVSSGPSPPEE